MQKTEIAFWGIFAFVFFLAIYIFKSYIWSFISAIILYFSFLPLSLLIKKHIKIKNNNLLSVILIILIAIFIFLPLFFIITKLVSEAYGFSIIISDIFKDKNLFHFFSKTPYIKKYISFLEEFKIDEHIKTFSSKITNFIVNSFGSIISFSFDLFIDIFFMFFILFFLFKEGERLRKILVQKILPFPDELEEMVIERIGEVVRKLFIGNIIMIMVYAFILSVGFLIADVPSSIFWGTIGGILSLVPVVGYISVWGIVAIYLMLQGKGYYALFVAIWSFVWYILGENVIKPIVVGKKIKLHPLIFFFAMLGGIENFGVWGIIIGPVIITLLVSLYEAYRTYKQWERKDNLFLE
jgi:predicted PurR-regulated permease PerM